MSVKNMVGLEAEVFVVTPVKRELVIAGERGVPCDDFCLIGEIRGEPGETPAKSASNFIKAYYEFLYLLEKKELDVSLDGSRWISHALYAKVMKSMGTKEWPECLNIYGTDISESYDVRLNKDTGRIEEHAVSCGLHVHFSSLEEDAKDIPLSTDVYNAVSIPLSIGEGLTANLQLYTKSSISKHSGTDHKQIIKVSASRITAPVVKYFVEQLDKEVLPKYKVDPITKYRQPGFYELKPWGFEYRSLPFTKEVFDNLLPITKFSFDLLNNL